MNTAIQILRTCKHGVFLLATACLLVPMHSPAQSFAGVDSFQSFNPAFWDQPDLTSNGTGHYLVADGALRYAITSSSADNAVLRTWKVRAGASVSWSVQIDVTVPVTNLTTGDFYGGLWISGGDANDRISNSVDFTMLAHEGSPIIEADLRTNGIPAGETTSPRDFSLSTLRVTYNPGDAGHGVPPSLRCDYQAGDCAWRRLYAVKDVLALWGMGENDTFAVALYAGSGPGVDAPSVTMDNFVARQGSRLGSGTAIEFSLETTSGTRYAVERSSDLSGNWEIIDFTEGDGFEQIWLLSPRPSDRAFFQAREVGPGERGPLILQKPGASLVLRGSNQSTNEIIEVATVAGKQTFPPLPYVYSIITIAEVEGTNVDTKITHLRFDGSSIFEKGEPGPEIMRFGQVGESWLSEDSEGPFRATIEAIETVTAPPGTYPNCRKVVKVNLVSQDEDPRWIEWWSEEGLLVKWIDYWVDGDFGPTSYELQSVSVP